MSNNRLDAFFSRISETLNGAETSFLDLLSVCAPYLVPVIPSYLTFFHTRDLMSFPTWVAATAAVVVEILGITSVSTAIRFYRHNQKYTSEKNKAPFWLAIGVYAFYLLIVLTVNTLLLIVSGSRTGAVIFAISAFTLMSVPSGVLISIRTQYREMLEEKEQAKRERMGKREGAQVAPQVAHSYAQDMGSQMRKNWNWASDEGKLRKDSQFILNSPVKDVQAKYGVSRRTVTNWKNALK